MTINYIMPINAEINFDGSFTHKPNEKVKTIDQYVECAKKLMKDYGFRTADIYDIEKHYAIIHMEANWQDDMSYDDDFDDYDREYAPENSEDLE